MLRSLTGVRQAAIMLSAFADGPGATDNTIEENTVIDHPQVCIGECAVCTLTARERADLSAH